MPLVGGPIEVLLVAAALMLALVVWLRRGRQYPGPRLHGDEGIDREELEEAEREVRELRQANEILRKASAYFAQAELDRRSRP